MGTSRLERRLRLVAWLVLLATALSLLSAGLMVQISAASGGAKNETAAAAAAPVEER